jgi:DOPA 4,5-dioxygenase
VIEAPSYHAHLYFEPARREEAHGLRDAAARALGDVATVYPPRDLPVGPHPSPMFEIAFTRDALAAVLGWVEANRGDFTVLVHPETGDDVADHRDHAIWLGRPLPLDYARL